MWALSHITIYNVGIIAQLHYIACYIILHVTDEFACYASKRTEYSRLFLSYAELMATTDSTTDPDCFITVDDVQTQTLRPTK